MDFAPLGIKFRQIKFLLNTSFIETEIVYCPRTCNKPAQALASLGASAIYGHNVTWATEFSEFVVRLVTGDLAVS
jgi:hypothetical protein